MLTLRNHSGGVRARGTSSASHEDSRPLRLATSRSRLGHSWSAEARRAGTRVRRASTRLVLVSLTASTRVRNRPHKRRYAFGLGRVVWRGPSTVYPDSAKVLLNLAPMMWQWQALGDLWYCQTAVSHPLVASVAQMPSGRPDQRLKHGRQAELFPRSPDASALGVVYYAGLAPPARSVVIVARRALVAVVRDLYGRLRHLRLPCSAEAAPPPVLFQQNC